MFSGIWGMVCIGLVIVLALWVVIGLFRAFTGAGNRPVDRPQYGNQGGGYGPQGAYYLSNHRGHLMFVREDERPYLTQDLIRHATWTATAPELIERIQAIEAAGFTQIVFSILPGQEHAVEDWGRIRRAFA